MQQCIDFDVILLALLSIQELGKASEVEDAN